MAEQLEGRPKEIFTEGKNYAHVSIPRGDGTVQSVIVWTHADEAGNVTLNSAEGRAWPNNLRKAGNATVTLMADGNPYEYVAVEAKLAEESHEGADEDIDFLAKKYLDADSYPFRKEGEQRVIFRLRPEKVVYQKG
jgi:PPOX class probable F420-dependent enzyme